MPLVGTIPNYRFSRLASEWSLGIEIRYSASHEMLIDA